MTRDDGADSGISRRQFVEGVGASGAAVGLSGYLDEGTVGNVQNQGGTTTVQWAADSNVKGVESALQKALHDVGLSNDIEISVLAGPNVTGNRRAQYQQWLSAGRSKPDLMMMDSGWTIPFIRRNQLLNLTDKLPQNKVKMVRNQYLQQLAKTGQSKNGNIYGVPFFPDIATIQYRKDLFEEAGHAPKQSWATESMRWKQFSNIVADVQQQTNTKMGFSFQAKAYEGLSCCDFNEFITSWGGAYFGNPRKNLFGPIGQRPVTLAQKPVVDSVRMVRSLIHGPDAQNTLNGYKQIAPQAVLQWSEEPSRKPFTAGNVVAHRNWTYSIRTNGAEDAFGKDLGVMPIPYAKTEQQAQLPATGGPTSALGGWLTSVNPNSKKQDAAIQVIKSMMNEDFMFRLFELLGWVPPNVDLLKRQRAKQVPIMGRYVEQLRVAAQAALPRPVTVVWPQESTQIAQQVNSAYAPGGKPQQAMQKLQQSIKAIEQSA
ncbi:MULTISPECIES: extracellular solute-binding protein [Halorussus]|uniref:extracellular solute-binding protein n=1 Tax=Halorussus TaxID=1070314 RepID=UPI0020A0D8F9|nr:extracellular solute-binding protein [Halorussus vallis]USZ75161.1 extracellular solute-binding protein [Halorussus vallis]